MHKTKQKTYEKFHQKSRFLARIPNETDFTYKHVIRFIEKNIKQKSISLLDTGCGVGPLSFYFADKGHRVTGIDISEKAIRQCKKSAKHLKINAKFICGDIEEIKQVRKYDVIVASELIEHVQDDKALLEKFHNLVKRKGRLIITTPSIQAPLYRMGLLKGFDKRVGHLRRYDRNQLSKMIEKAGFDVEKIQNNEGILRNFLFTFSIGGSMLKIINRMTVLGKLVTHIDNLFIKLFGPSNYFVLATKK